MDHPDPQSPAAPVDRLATVREWLWRHSSQPNGDPWDGDPEHLEWAARNPLNDLIQSVLTTTPPTKAGPSPVLRTLGVAALRERGMDRGVHST
jgi:hypothetical protein